MAEERYEFLTRSKPRECALYRWSRIVRLRPRRPVTAAAEPNKVGPGWGKPGHNRTRPRARLVRLCNRRHMDPQTIVFKTVKGLDISIDVYHVPNATEPAPILLWYHGGGLLQGTRKGESTAQRQSTCRH